MNNSMNRTGTEEIDFLSAAPKNTSLAWQILTEQHCPIMKDIKMQKAGTYLGAAERWMSFPEDKSIVLIRDCDNDNIR